MLAFVDCQTDMAVSIFFLPLLSDRSSTCYILMVVSTISCENLGRKDGKPNKKKKDRKKSKGQKDVGSGGSGSGKGGSSYGVDHPNQILSSLDK